MMANRDVLFRFGFRTEQVIPVTFGFGVERWISGKDCLFIVVDRDFFWWVRLIRRRLILKLIVWDFYLLDLYLMVALLGLVL